MNLIDVYDTEEEEYILEGITYKTAANYFRISVKRISQNLNNGNKLKGRYKLTIYEQPELESIKEMDSWYKNFCTEWDKIHDLAQQIKEGRAVIKSEYVNGKLRRWTELGERQVS